ncbi:MAG: cytochrome c biogenesis protein CcdA [Paracoccus sp. (in: a-proteobacteria)]|uniref:cytochrome c biogenesis CcdA family protein n=1 Tax=Paracoccus sp. TaxID=267 RepID=UPI0039E2C3A3
MFGIEIADAAFVPAALAALLAGVLSFLSPCVLPVVPPYLAYMTGVGVGSLRAGERSAIVPALFFVLGLSTVFLLMGMAASAFGRMFLQYQDWLAKGAGLVVVIMGLHFLRVIRIPLLDSEARLDAGDKGGSSFGAYVLGLAFAFGWTPCIGPQLGMILSLAATGAETGRGAALLAFYALGLGVPFLLSAVFINRAMGLMSRIKPHLKLIERAMGALLIVVGLALVTGAFPVFAYWLLETFPWLARLG